MTTTTGPAAVAVIGTGWRAKFFAKLALAMPDRFTLVAAGARRQSAADEAGRAWDVPAFLDPAELIRRTRPDFVVTSVPAAVNAELVVALVTAGAKVLTETPPAPGADALRRLWSEVGSSRRVQVAEQYLLLPGHAARLAIVRNGVIGTPTSVQVSSTHGYHAVSIMRGFLGVGCEPATVSATRFNAPLINPLGRDGWTDDDEPKNAGTVLAAIDFGEGRSGLYDFTDNQWHNQLRFRRILVRGSRGEIVDDRVVRLAERHAIVNSELLRYQLGHDLNLDGYDTEHISFDGRVVYRNPFVAMRLMDEEIAIGALMSATGAWAREQGPEPYPLAAGCQDQLIALAIERSFATGSKVATGIEPWSADRA